MKTKFLLLLSAFFLVSCVSEEEQRAAAYRQEEFLRAQCAQFGFSAGTQDYMSCRMFYADYLQAFGYESAYSLRGVQNMQAKVNDLTNRCSQYWGYSGVGAYLWPCIQQLGQKQIEQMRHAKELEEQEAMLTRSIAAGQREANEESRIQGLIDAERARVAAATGKNPKKIYCSTSTRSNGYVSVKCK